MVVLILLIRKHAARNGVAYLKSCEPVGELDKLCDFVTNFTEQEKTIELRCCLFPSY